MSAGSLQRHDTALGLSYYTTQAGAMSFESDKVRGFVSQFIEPTDRVLNLCAGDTELDVGAVDRNDVRPEVESEYTEDVRDLFEIVDEKYDVVIFDPPFSLHQHTQTYGLNSELWPGYGEHIATGLASLLKQGGRAIQFGFHATIDPADTTELTPTHVGIFQQLGRSYDWCATVATKAGAPDGKKNTLSLAAETKVCPNPSDNGAVAPSFDIRYRRSDAEELESVIATEILQDIDRPAGKTLALVWGDQPAEFEFNFDAGESAIADVVIPYSGPADRLKACSLGHGDSKDGIEIHPEDLHTEVPQLDYDNVVIWPDLRAYNWNIEYHGESCGYVRAMKRTLDKILGSGTTVYTVGRTMTGMRDAWGYEHHGVTVVDHISEQESWYVSRFEKPQSGLGEVQQSNVPIDMGYRETETAPNWVTVNSLTSWYYHPAFYTPCTECGAHQNAHCVNGDTIVPMHEARIDWFRESYRKNDTVRWYRNRGFGRVSQTPNHDWSGTATPSSTTNTEDDITPPSTASGAATESTTITQFVSD